MKEQKKSSYWDYGTISKGSAVAVAHVGIGIKKSISHDVGERIYYRKMGHVRLMLWK